jgi:hypothetical protein
MPVVHRLCKRATRCPKPWGKNESESGKAGDNGRAPAPDAAVELAGKALLLHRSAEDNGDGQIYRVIELVGTSENSIEDAVNSAVDSTPESVYSGN